MKRIVKVTWKTLLGCLLVSSALSASAIEAGDVILNEIYIDGKDGQNQGAEAVELLVVADNVNLNGLQISDRDNWNRNTEDQCTIQDMGKGFLSSVRAGTLIVIHRSAGKDDIDPANFLIRLYAKTSVYCNIAPTGFAFRLPNNADNFHLLYFSKQIDFVKYSTSNFEKAAPGNPGKLSWNGGEDGFINMGKHGENNGARFLGNRPELNDYPAAWQAYSEAAIVTKTLGRPNGGPNTVWINQLREQSSQRNSIVRTGE